MMYLGYRVIINGEYHKDFEGTSPPTAYEVAEFINETFSEGRPHTITGTYKNIYKPILHTNNDVEVKVYRLEGYEVF